MPDDSKSLLCPRCGDMNAPKALVCSICGARLPQNEAPANSEVEAQETVLDAAEAIPVEALAAEVPHENIAREIDLRRAYHLLERAFILAERHEFEAAVLACRQSLLLAPNVALGSALLALFLKRQGDATGAANAFAKAEQLASGNAWEQSTLASLHTLFKKEESALLAAAQHENLTAPTGQSDALTATPHSTPSNHAPALKLAKPEDAENSKSAIAQETILPARPKNWLPFAAVGTVIFIGLIWLYKSFTPPAPVARDSVVAGQNVVAAPSAEIALQPDPTSSNGGLVAPPVPTGGQKETPSGAANNQVVGQSAPSPGQSGSQVPVERRMQPSTGVVTNRQPSGEAARVNGNNSPVTVSPTVAEVRQAPLPPPMGSAAAPDTSTQSGGALSAPRSTPAPMSAGNSRPGGPRNSIPGAFQPGKP